MSGFDRLLRPFGLQTGEMGGASPRVHMVYYSGGPVGLVLALVQSNEAFRE
jgi:hypothetical protein